MIKATNNQTDNNNLFSFGFGLFICRLENAGCGHQVFDVLTQNLIFGSEPQVLLLDVVHAGREIIEGVLELQYLVIISM